MLTDIPVETPGQIYLAGLGPSKASVDGLNNPSLSLTNKLSIGCPIIISQSAVITQMNRLGKNCVDTNMFRLLLDISAAWKL